MNNVFIVLPHNARESHTDDTGVAYSDTQHREVARCATIPTLLGHKPGPAIDWLIVITY